MAQDLRNVYRKHMRHHGCGMAMYQPIAFKDIEPPCCGYFDINGKWNLIANLRLSCDAASLGLLPLPREPVRMRQIGLRWQPKCSKGVRMFNVDLSGKTPTGGIPVGADAHLKYQSKKSFGAVLIARNPVEVTAYNDESLFKDWIEINKAQLYNRLGHQLKKYGLWLITTTYTAPGCSINAWMDKGKDAILSAKAKAAMVGDFGAELDWTDKITDKDWCHYTAKSTSSISDTTPVVPGSKTKAMRSSGNRPGSKSRSPHPAAAVSESQTFRDFTHQQGTSHLPARNSDGQSTRSLSRKPAFNPDYNRIRISKLDTEGDHKVHPSDLSAHQTPVSPSTSATEGVDDTTFPEIAIAKNTHQNLAVDPAAGGGVVMFYDGLYVNPLEWWVEGAKSMTTSLLGSAQPSGKINSGVEHHTLVRNHSLRNNDRVQITRANNQHYRPRRAAPKSSKSTANDFDVDYCPDKDEGVHTRYWPTRNPCLPSNTEAANQTSFVSEGSKRNAIHPIQGLDHDGRARRYSVGHRADRLYHS